MGPPGSGDAPPPRDAWAPVGPTTALEVTDGTSALPDDRGCGDARDALAARPRPADADIRRLATTCYDSSRRSANPGCVPMARTTIQSRIIDDLTPCLVHYAPGAATLIAPAPPRGVVWLSRRHDLFLCGLGSPQLVLAGCVGATPAPADTRGVRSAAGSRRRYTRDDSGGQVRVGRAGRVAAHRRRLGEAAIGVWPQDWRTRCARGRGDAIHDSAAPAAA